MLRSRKKKFESEPNLVFVLWGTLRELPRLCEKYKYITLTKVHFTGFI